jgi:septum formation protein
MPDQNHPTVQNHLPMQKHSSIQNHPLILASKSPRRQELLKLMDLQFDVLLKDVDEDYPEGLEPEQVAQYISEKKARAFLPDRLDAIVITADTIVSYNDEILGKPNNALHAVEMLTKLAGNKHEVYTGVSLTFQGEINTFYDVTEVFFKKISLAQIEYYIEHYQPFDKAGSYGVQDWIGMVAVEKIVGSYTNVMGLPTEKLYTALANYK